MKMGKETSVSMELSPLVKNGKLTKEEALEALKNAAITANEELPKAEEKCKTEDDRRKVKGDRDLVVLSYLRSLKKSLAQTGPLFEKMAEDLQTEASNVREKAKKLKNTVEAINLFTELVRFATSLALAFA